MKKIVMVLVFLAAIISMNACKSTSSSCSSIEKQEINNPKTATVIVTTVTT